MVSSNLCTRSFCYGLALLLVSTNNNSNSAVVTAFVPSQSTLKTMQVSPVIMSVHVAFEKKETAEETSNNSAVGNDVPGDAKEENSSSSKLSRPMRKALERAQRESGSTGSGGGGGGGNRKKNKDNNTNNNNNKKARQAKKTYELHSQAISSLTLTSTADDVLRAIKRAQNLHDSEDLRTIHQFLVEEVDEHFAFGYRGSLLSRLAVAALHMNEHELARSAITVRRVEYRKTMLPLESAAIIRGLLRVQNMTDALETLDDELSLPMPGTPLTTEESKERLKWRALALTSIASRHFFAGEPTKAVLTVQKLSELGPIIRQAELSTDELKMPWSRLMLGASQCESGRRDGSVVVSEEDAALVELPCNLVYSVLGAMSTFPSDNSDETYERVSNALVRRVLFLTGAINMKGCPPPDRGEVAFIGRSNVGKSSLINMVTNRKSLAYTSKRPGKTQQFNFFSINDKANREKEIRYGDEVLGEADGDSFLIADLPGFGFAKVPQQQRDEWAAFMAEYLKVRSNLRVVFHLVDSRHGPTDEDKKIMKQVSENLPAKANYVVVLTKADKNIKGAPGKVSKDVQQALRDAMNENGVGKRPVILSSSNTKLGRDDLWRYIKLAAEV